MTLETKIRTWAYKVVDAALCAMGAYFLMPEIIKAIFG